MFSKSSEVMSVKSAWVKVDNLIMEGCQRNLQTLAHQIVQTLLTNTTNKDELLSRTVQKNSPKYCTNQL